MRWLACLLLSRGAPCGDCARWNETQARFRIYGNTYYVGVRGLSSVLISSEKGHILIDGDLPESAAKIAASIESLGFPPAGLEAHPQLARAFRPRRRHRRAAAAERRPRGGEQAERDRAAPGEVGARRSAVRRHPALCAGRAHR